MIERNNTNVALDTIFEEVFAIISDAKGVPFSDKILVDEVELSNLIDDLREAIPKEIKSATQVLEEQKNIVNKAYQDADRIKEAAQAEADRIVGMAQAKADAMIQQEEIVKLAAAEAERMRAEADAYQQQVQAAADEYALRIKQDSLQYADDMLAFVGGHLQSALQDVKDSRENIINAINEVGNPVPTQNVEETEQYEEE